MSSEFLFTLISILDDAIMCVLVGTDN